MKIIAPRQKTNYHCGVACALLMARLLGKHFKEDDIATQLNASPGEGVDNITLGEWAISNLNASFYGNHTWNGGLAIINLRNKDSDVGHYVVLLGIKDNIAKYYCPLLGRVVTEIADKMVWKASTPGIVKWAINFENITIDFYNAEIEPEPFIFFIGEDLDWHKKQNDASFKLFSYCKAKNNKTFWYSPKDIFCRGRNLYLDGIPVLHSDLVWIRLNPFNTVHYYETLRQLSTVNAKFINSPKSILTCHDKLYTLYFEEDSYFIAYSESNVRRACNHILKAGYSKFVIKTPSRFGGENIFLCDSATHVIKMFNNIKNDSGFVLLQPFYDTGTNQTDKRIFITPYSIVGIVDRIYDTNEFAYNINSKITSIKKSNKISEYQLKKVYDIQATMISEGIFMIVVDFIGDHLTEINVSCVSTIHEINQVESVEIMDIIWNDLMNYLKN